MVCSPPLFGKLSPVPEDRIYPVPQVPPSRPFVLKRRSARPAPPASTEDSHSRPQKRSVLPLRGTESGTTLAQSRQGPSTQLHPSAWISWFILRAMYHRIPSSHCGVH